MPHRSALHQSPKFLPPANIGLHSIARFYLRGQSGDGAPELTFIRAGRDRLPLNLLQILIQIKLAKHILVTIARSAASCGQSSKTGFASDDLVLQKTHVRRDKPAGQKHALGLAARL